MEVHHLATSVNGIALVGDANVLDVIVVEVREVLQPQIELGMLNAALQKRIESGEILNVVLLKMSVLREESIGIAEVVKESLSGIDIKAESQVGSRAEI